MKKSFRRTLSLFLSVLMLCLIALPASAAESTAAATMQLMKTTGTVDVTNASRRSLTRRDHMRLYNGYHVKTTEKSYAWISLDSTKLVKLDAVSETEVRKSGKELELLVSEGNLFFNVTEPLKEDETLNIRTSTMMVGVRGTSGWIKVLDRWGTEIYVLEGTVQCSATDPVTGQTKTESIRAGEKAIALAYPQDREGDKCDILMDRFEPGDVDGFVLTDLAQDPGLCADIYDETGMDVLPNLGELESKRRQSDSDDLREQVDDAQRKAEADAQGRLEVDQQTMQDILDDIEAQLAEQDNNASTDNVWEQSGPSPDAPGKKTASSGGADGSDDGGGDTAGSNDSGGAAESVSEFRMYKTASEVQQYLTEHGAGTYTLLPSTSGIAADNLLTVDINWTIPSGTTLNLGAGINVVIDNGSSLTVNGTLNSTGTLTNNGALTVNSGNTLTTASIVNNGTLRNTGSGHIAANTVTTSGTFTNTGRLEGTVIHTGGSTSVTGGTVKNSGTGAALTARGGGTIRVTGGTIDGGSLPALLVDSASVQISIGDLSGGPNSAILKSKKQNSVVQFNADGAKLQYVPGGGSPVSGDILTTVSDGGGSYRLANVSANIADALTNAKDGEVVVLTRDVPAESIQTFALYSPASPVPFADEIVRTAKVSAEKLATEGRLEAVLYADNEQMEPPRDATYKWYEIPRSLVVGANGYYNLYTDEAGTRLIYETSTNHEFYVFNGQDLLVEAPNKYYVEVSWTDGDGSEVSVKSSEYEAVYYGELKNGSFEMPVIDGRAALIYENDGNFNRAGSIEPGGGDIEGDMGSSLDFVWRSTTHNFELFTAVSVGGDPRGYHFVTGRGDAWIPDGKQAAEINADSPGTLYQAILTRPGSTIYWGLSHRGRGGEDTMGVYMGGTDPSKGDISGDEQGRYTTDNDEWRFYSGSYVVPQGQYITYFSLKAISSTANWGDDAVGNLIDYVQVSIAPVDYPDVFPAPPNGQSSLWVRKTVVGQGGDFKFQVELVSGNYRNVYVGEFNNDASWVPWDEWNKKSVTLEPMSNGIATDYFWLDGWGLKITSPGTYIFEIREIDIPEGYACDTDVWTMTVVTGYDEDGGYGTLSYTFLADGEEPPSSRLINGNCVTFTNYYGYEFTKEIQETGSLYAGEEAHYTVTLKNANEEASENTAEFSDDLALGKLELVPNTVMVDGVLRTDVELTEPYGFRLTEPVTIPGDGEPVIITYTAIIKDDAGVGWLENTATAVVEGNEFRADASLFSPGPRYSLTIYYVYEDGGMAAATFRGQYAEGEDYSIPSPEITGYRADIPVVEGVMPAMDREFTVTYRAVSPDPTNPNPYKFVTVTGGGVNDPVVLDLNGHALDMGETGIHVYGALSICDSGGAKSGVLKLDSYIQVGNDTVQAHLFLDSGTISGSGDAAIVVYAGSDFTKNGGTVNGKVEHHSTSAGN